MKHVKLFLVLQATKCYNSASIEKKRFDDMVYSFFCGISLRLRFALKGKVATKSVRSKNTL